MANVLTQERLKALLRYDPATGVFTRLVRLPKSHYGVGEVAGSLNDSDAVMIMVDGKRHRAHRLAWLYMTGRWPSCEIDHRNRKRHDNRWSNLREATRGQQGQNMSKHRDGKSGFLGVTWRNDRRKWKAQIQVDGMRKCIGLFDEPQAAHEAYLKAKADLHTFNPVLEGER